MKNLNKINKFELFQIKGKSVVPALLAAGIFFPVLAFPTGIFLYHLFKNTKD